MIEEKTYWMVKIIMFFWNKNVLPILFQLSSTVKWKQTEFNDLFWHEQNSSGSNKNAKTTKIKIKSAFNWGRIVGKANIKRLCMYIAPSKSR